MNTSRGSKPNIALTALSVSEWIMLARRAEQRCRERFAVLARDPRGCDRELSKTLRNLALEGAAHGQVLTQLDETTPKPKVIRLDDAAIDRLVALHFPSLFAPPAGDADWAVLRRFIAGVERERAEFYASLAAAAPTAPARRCFVDLARREGGQRSSVRDEPGPAGNAA